MYVKLCLALLCLFQLILEGYDVYDVDLKKEAGQSLGITIVGYVGTTTGGEAMAEGLGSMRKLHAA